MIPAIVTRQKTQKAKIQTRSMSKPNSALLEAKKRGRQKLNTKTPEMTIVKDIFQTAMNSINLTRHHTGIIYDNDMIEHNCLWDSNYPESPERFSRILKRCEELKLIERCSFIKPRLATKDEILLQHTEEHYNILKSTANINNEDELEELCSKYDAIYINQKTFILSLLACGSTIELVENILTGKCQNGMAIIRPPGHHAMKSEFNGYCFFNNVAIAAQYALCNLNVNKILIVDWDVHHGQGTQKMFYNDPRVLYFSIHRYEDGEFWPSLRESNFDYIGENEGKGFNINVPLNKVGMTNSDFLAAFQQILLPVAVEFCPDLIIISAGYDSAIGDEKGLMEVTPVCYSHLLSPLMALAEGKVAVILEGGYCLNSLAEGAAITLKTLLGDPCPTLELPLQPPCDSMQESILNCIYVHKPFWRCLNLQKTYNLEELNNVNPQPNLHKVNIKFKEVVLPERFATRNCYSTHPEETLRHIEKTLEQLKLNTNLAYPKNRVSFVYDDIMMEHKHLSEDTYPERPERIELIKKRFDEYHLINRMKQLKIREATTDELRLVHSHQHINFIRKAVRKDDLNEISETFNSVFLHPSTYKCASYAAGSVLQVVDEVVTGKSRSGICVIRPPGHHAESDTPHGFCIFNNVAIAAQYAVRDHGLKRVLIIDWDVHHGNGIQHIFEKNPKVLYISLHRYDHGVFFPSKKDGDYTVVGEGDGEGFNVNIPWNKRTMGDAEYITAFQHIILPIAYEYNPELVLISAGFDAAIGDPLGGYKVSPEAYGYFTLWLSSLANGKIIVCLEGGYNVNSISYAMTMCAKALLGDPLPQLQHLSKTGANSSCIETLQNVVSVQQKYWKCLKFNKKLPEFDYKNKTELVVLESTLENAFDALQISKMNGVHDSDDKNSEQSRTNRPLPKSEIEPQPGSSRVGEAKQTLVDYLSENMQALKNEEMFAVVPLKTCPHLSTLQQQITPNQIDTKAACENCESKTENWICLGCFKILCGRYIMEHMLYHHLETDHPLTLSFSDLSVWCYKCEAYIDNPILFKYKNLAHINKFGEELEWSYGHDSVFLEINF